jgi:hypothetical protein
MLLSAAVTLVSNPEIAVAFPVTLVFVVVSEDSRVLISDALVVIFPSAVVIRVPRELIAVALAATPVVGSFTVD